MNVTTRLMNPQALTTMYGKFPLLSGTELTEVHIKQDEPRVSIKLITQEKPTTCPKRWPKEYDEVFIGLSFIGVRHLSFSDWGHENIVDEFLWQDVDEAVAVRISCRNHTKLTFTCDWTRIESVTYGLVGSP